MSAFLQEPGARFKRMNHNHNFEQKEAKGAKQDKSEIVCCLAAL